MSHEADVEPSADQKAHPKKQRNTSWGLFAYTTLALVTIAVIWGLALSTILVNRSGQTTSQVLELLETQQASSEQTVDELQAQLKSTRATTKAEVDAVRRDTTQTSDRVTKLAENNAKAWQQIARDASGNLDTNSKAWQNIVRDTNRGLASASDRRQDLIGSTANGSARQRSVVEPAALAAVQRAERRAAAAETSARTALTRAEKRAKADRLMIETSTRAALQLAVDGADDRLERAREQHRALTRQWEQPTEAATAELERAHQRIEAAAKERQEAVTGLTNRELGPSRIVAITERLKQMHHELTRAENVLDRLSSLDSHR